MAIPSIQTYAGLVEELCHHLKEMAKAAATGDRAAQRWLCGGFAGHTLMLESFWNQPFVARMTPDEQVDYRRAALVAEVQRLFMALGTAQSEIRDIDDSQRAEQDRHLIQEIVARRAQWEFTQQAEQQEAARQRYEEEQRRQQDATQRAQEAAQRTARAIQEREAKNSADIARKREELIAGGFMP